MPLNDQAERFLNAAAAADVPSWDAMDVAVAREMFAQRQAQFGRGPEIGGVINSATDGGVPIRIYRPVTAEMTPVVLFFHGGGWVLGDVDTHDAICRNLVAASQFTVVSVDYRRAPDHPFPGALDDCYAATEYVYQNADNLGVDSNCVFVCGDSAGGNLAATVCLKARDENGPQLRGQILVYPVIAPCFDTSSYLECATDYGLTRDTMKWFWQQYLGGQSVTPLASPARAESLAGLPPAHVILAEYDVLRDEGQRYAEQLQAAGVSVTVCQYDGMIHGFIQFGAVLDAGQQAIADIGRVLQSMTDFQSLT